MGEFICTICGLKYSFRSGLQRHVKQFHGEVSSHKQPPSPSLYCVVCSLENASVSFDSKKTFNKHLADVHDLPVTTVSKSFGSVDEFYRWKRELEEETCSAFVRPNGTVKCKSSQRLLFECHRSGVYHAKGKSLRQLKAQGSKKIGGYCPAEIKLIVENNGSCSATYITTHWGHDNDLTHLVLTKEERASIASKIAQKIPFDDILDEIRHSVTDPGDLRRLHLLTKKDLHNIKVSFSLHSDMVKHQSDPVMAWVSTKNGRATKRGFASLQREKEETLSALRDVTSLVRNSNNIEVITAVKKLVLEIPSTISAIQEVPVK